MRAPAKCIAIRMNTAARMFEYEFMRTAFAASGVAAILAGAVGFFLVLRGQTFAGHALSHVGFTGATGAALIGLSPLAGLVGFTLAAGIGMGFFGEKLAQRDVSIGMMLSLALGLGLLFLHFYTSAATQATALLFGNVLGVDKSALTTLAVLAFGSLAALAIIARPLVFASLQSELAEARGVPVRFVSVAFLAIVAIAVAECAQIVGVLLVFTLMVGPAAAAQNFSRRLERGVALAAGLALMEAWGGLTLAFYTDWPTSFWITALSGVVYFASLAARRAAGWGSGGGSMSASWLLPWRRVVDLISLAIWNVAKPSLFAATGRFSEKCFTRSASAHAHGIVVEAPEEKAQRTAFLL